MTKRILPRTCVLGLLGAAALTLGGCDALGGPTCEKVIGKAVETMVAAQGDNSMIKTEHIGKLVAGCEANKAVEAHPDAAKCALDAKDFDALKACPDFNALMKASMKGS
ncbi:MAG: hypothetical protein IAG13_24790 [Deltaproteobacteria bacterium]|nr:hypothetical protein [Nannocystaceae bacterium]